MSNSNDTQLKEYEVANQVLMNSSNLKLAEATIFVGVTGGLLTVLFDLKNDQESARVVLKIFGLLSSLCFIAMLESTQHQFFHFASRAARLEKDHLGFSLWSSFKGAPTFSKRPGTWALRVFVWAAVLFWIIALFLDDF